ncbi:sugar transporter [Epibacterium ulvae]|uniref:sugar transporter n=1 Tax=Epibacterium ulvae TaxID=1156985 RepID=UPI0024931471|nr:sugar transporter [Epibacterium ulvae]
MNNERDGAGNAAMAIGAEPTAGHATDRPKAAGPGKQNKQPRLAMADAPPAMKSPMAAPARMQKRHWGLFASFFLLVLAPLLAVIFYLFVIAEDRYASTAGFSVRSQENSGANELLGGLAQLAGGSTASDGDILYEYIRSQELVAEVDAELNLKEHFGSHWPKDWAFALWPEPTLEQLTWYWQRVVGISYDSGSGLIEIQATAYDPEMAQAMTGLIVDLSQIRINALNEQARADAMRYARIDLEESLERLKVAREALIQFRTRTRIVDPETDIQGRMGVMNNLQQQLAEALIDLDLLRGSLGENDPRITTGQKRIDVIRERINLERNSFASSDATDTGGIGEDYPSLISEYERLSVDREFAEETYRAALTALEVARAEATRQSRYLATYIKPTRAESSQYPQSFILTGLAALFLLLSWAILALVYYSIRDRR